MTNSVSPAFDPDRDLRLEREIDVPIDDVWAAWTEPDQLKQWFTPAPYETIDCEIDLRPGGTFRTVMRSPAGDESTTTGCYLDVDTPRRLIWTTILGPEFRPATDPTVSFTAVLTFEPIDIGTRYTALVMHPNADSAGTHARLGFHGGWSSALDQLVTMIHRRSLDSTT